MVIIPITAITTSTGNSNFISSCRSRYSLLSASVAAAPNSTMTLTNRAKPSLTNEPSNAVSVPSGWNPMNSPRATSRTHDAHSTSRPTSRPA